MKTSRKWYSADFNAKVAQVLVRADQGSEFISRELNLRPDMYGVTLNFSRLGRPTDIAFIESFNGKVRTECLGQHWFLSLDDVVRKCGLRLRDDNEVRPHSAIGTTRPRSVMFPSAADGSR